jgi:hypothetical protein
MSNLQIIGSKRDLQKFVQVVIETFNLNRQITTTDSSQLISQQKMAEKLDVTVATLIKRRNKNEFPFYRIGIKYLYNPDKVFEAIENKLNK